MKKAFVLIGFMAAVFLLYGGEIAKADSLSKDSGGVSTMAVVDPGTGGR